MEILIEYLENFKWNSAHNGGVASCPFHKDSKPSFGISFAKNRYHCFSCNAKGTLQLLMKHFNIVSNNAIKIEEIIKEEENVDLYKKFKNYKLKTEIPENLIDSHEYLEFRNVTPFIKKKYNIKYDIIEKAMFIPIYNSENELIGNYRRYNFPKNGQKGKYSVDFKISENLFGINLYSFQNTLIITEGLLDCARSYEHLYNLNLLENIFPISTFSKHLSINHVQIIKQLGIENIILFYDNDLQGQLGIEKIIKDYKNKIGINLYKINWMNINKKDPDELFEEEFSEILKNISKI
jgi:5S rRNA maturation endonuclease (ribonuclease M5)